MKRDRLVFRVPKTKVTYARGTLGTGPLPVLSGSTLGTGLTATYYPTPDLTGPPAINRIEPSVGLHRGARRAAGRMVGALDRHVHPARDRHVPVLAGRLG